MSVDFDKRLCYDFYITKGDENMEQIMEEKFLTLESLGNSDANVFEIGFQDCSSNRLCENYIPPHNVVHFIVKGHGIFKVKNTEYEVGPGFGMFSPKDVPVTYHTSEDDPWYYVWFHFSGIKFAEYLNQMNINTRSPIYKVSNAEYCRQRIETMYHQYGNCTDKTLVEAQALSLCYDLFARLMEDNPQRTVYSHEETQQVKYVEQSIQYMRGHVHEGIKVTQVSSAVGLNSNYLSALFKDETGLSLQQYLIRLRLQTAMQILSDSDLSIAEVAAMVGYQTSAAFCKAFHALYGITPESGRKRGFGSGKARRQL